MQRLAEQPIRYRNMTRADIASGLELCRASRWNQAAWDWELFLRLSPSGCRVAVRDGRVVGTVTTVRYEDRFSWIGMALVDPAERGQGIGTQLLGEALKILKDETSIRLDATPAGQSIYHKLNFIDEYWLSRMETRVSGLWLDGKPNPARLMMEADLPGVLELDRAVFGADRRVTLEWVLEGAPEYAWIITHGGRVAGYTFGRHGFNFEHLGPVIAEDQEIARQLVSACLGRQVGKRFILDASHHNADWRPWLESIGFREQRPFIRMYRGENPYPGLPEKQFGILGPEFG
ncbi:MAG: GNAT family N-acetyltransferase [Blastocatellia bacterium]